MATPPALLLWSAAAIFLLWPPGAVHAQAPGENAAPQSVVVSARKRDEAILDVPLAVTAFSAQALDEYGIRSFADYASKVPNLSFAYGNGASAGETGTGMANARTIAIRGISGARTTGYYVDDTPLPGAIDARVLDLRAIEILKGPQGTLYGESSMGGNVRLISNAPSLNTDSWRYQVEAGRTAHADDGLDGGASVVGNVVLVPGQSALRLVAFGEDLGGYLSRYYRSDIGNPASPLVRVGDQAAQRSFGGSVTGLLRVSPQLNATARLMHQDSRAKGMAAAYAPLPAFRPVDGVPRTADVQPMSGDRWSLASLGLDYAAAGWTLHSSTSWFTRQARDVEDSSEGTAQYLAGRGAVPPQAFAWHAARGSRQWTHETRAAFTPGGKWSGIVGVHYSSLRTVRETPPVTGNGVLRRPGDTLLWVYQNRYRQDNASLFGELYYQLSPSATLTLGSRWYWLEQDNYTEIDGAIYGVPLRSDTASRASGNSPKVALSWRTAEDAMLYASAAKGFRAGGAQADLTPLLGGCISAEEARRLARVDADSLWSYEAGAKLALPGAGAGRALLLTGALYRIDWDRIQQPAFVPGCAFYLLGNAGAARIQGAELELNGRLAPAFSMRLGLGYADARITEQGSSRQLAGERIKQVPAWTATAGGVYSAALAPGWQGTASLDYSYTGASVSSNSTTLPLRRPGYGLLNARLAVSRGNAELALQFKNLGDARVNLGDLGYLGYQRFEADGKTPLPQVATLPPRSVMLQFRQRY